MTNVLLLLIGIGIYWSVYELRRIVVALQTSLEVPEEVVVKSPTTMPIKEKVLDAPSIVEPKTPQRLQWEEEEEIRKLNLGAG